MNEEMSLTVAQPTDQLGATNPGCEKIAAMTPAQARVDAVSNVLHKAYERASTLALTPEEIQKLKADFPNEAFKLGAGGNPDLLYLEHAYLRDRFDDAIGMGQWALVRSRPHWGEDFVTQKGQKATRIYADCALLIRGCLVSEAIGEMVYYPNNATQSYGDAAEGSETAAFRRCAKKLGVGLQAWKKDFCAAWMAQHRKGPEPVRYEVKPTPAPVTNVPLPTSAEGWKIRFIDRAHKATPLGRIAAWAWAVNAGIIMENERLQDGSAAKFPQSLDDAKLAEIDIARAAKAGIPDGVQALYQAAYASEPPDQIPGLEMPESAPEPDMGSDYKVLEGWIQASGSKPTAKGGKRFWFAVNKDMNGSKETSVYMHTFDQKVADAIAALPSPKNVRICYSDEGKFGSQIQSVTGI